MAFKVCNSSPMFITNNHWSLTLVNFVFSSNDLETVLVNSWDDWVIYLIFSRMKLIISGAHPSRKYLNWVEHQHARRPSTTRKVQAALLTARTEILNLLRRTMVLSCIKMMTCDDEKHQIALWLIFFTII